MSISVALSNALSGLTASSRMASIASSNIANSLTEGYARRELAMSPRAFTGGGVNLDGVVRHIDSALVTERRDIGASFSNADTISTYRQRVETIFGTPEDSFSLSATYAAFETALVAAASRPDLPERLNAVLAAAGNVTNTLSTAQNRIQTLREEADAEIATTVERANALLVQVDDLNTAVTETRNRGGDVSGLLDLRQSAVDELSEIVPVRSVPRDQGTIALFTSGGAILLDGAAGEFGFAATNVITPHQTVTASLLSGLTINGNDVPLRDGGPIDGGRLAALFKIRDDLAVEAQTRVDAAARDLVERFQDSGLDATRGLGDPGLFTDNGAAFLAADEVGLAGRISVNALVDPAQGGATWRLRDGLGAAVPGDVGQASLLQDLKDVMTTQRVPASVGFGPAAVSAAGMASTILSLAGSERHLSEEVLGFASARRSEVEERYLSEGVDTDQEMQRLILVEQSYAANARMVQTIDEMMNILLRI